MHREDPVSATRTAEGADAPTLPADPAVETLFRPENLDRGRMGPLQWLLLIVWTPFGIPLMLVRAALMILVSLVVPPMYRAWWITVFAGIFLRVKNRTKIRDHGVVVVSNHLTYFDGVTVRAAVRSRRPLATLMWHKVNDLNKRMGRPYILVHESGRNRRLLQDVKAYLEHGNILLFPEATVTDGSGLLRFEKMAFSLNARVVVVTVQYDRPFRWLHPSALREKLIVQCFLEMFQPWTVARLEVLGVETRHDDETPEQFARRIQQRIADALQIPATAYTWRDRRRLMAARRASD